MYSTPVDQRFGQAAYMCNAQVCLYPDDHSRMDIRHSACHDCLTQMQLLMVLSSNLSLQSVKSIRCQYGTKKQRLEPILAVQCQRSNLSNYACKICSPFCGTCRVSYADKGDGMLTRCLLDSQVVWITESTLYFFRQKSKSASSPWTPAELV